MSKILLNYKMYENEISLYIHDIDRQLFEEHIMITGTNLTLHTLKKFSEQESI